ncbi:MAG TPA: endolytic transglycosylase MltG [Spirochaetia bacterium]|nr:endolytic transglycosylase MltG [Spirochaetia bacterium]
MRKHTTLLRVLGLVLGVIAVTAAAVAFVNSSPRRQAAGDRLFSIERGETLSRISARLQDEGFIRFAPFLDAIGRVGGTQGDFKAGYYRIPAGASTLAIHWLLVEGAQSLEKVTIPEGWTVTKIARHLEAQGVCSAGDFLRATQSEEIIAKLGVQGRSLEGFLFPDTYYVPRPFPADAMVEVMVRTFFDSVTRIHPGWREMPPEKLRDTVIMASIVEREYRAPDEAPLIASVFYNRLKRNMGLESCATLEYIITEIQQKAHPEYITKDDEKLNSPYNTYKWAGLPPGPIANPGKTALEAAFNPAQTDYLYFVLRDPDAGRHYFSRDLSEHNQAKYLYLKKS